MSLTDDERKEFLADLGLNPNAPALAADVPAEASPKASKGKGGKEVRLAPDGVDPRAMPVSDIVFDPHLLDGFPSLEGEGMSAASRHIFGLYKSHGRNKDRNSLLHRKITEFIGQVRRERATGGVVKEKVKATKEQREIANLLAAKGLTLADLAALLDD